MDAVALCAVQSNEAPDRRWRAVRVTPPDALLVGTPYHCFAAAVAAGFLPARVSVGPAHQA